MARNIARRGEWYYYFRRVPRCVAHLDSRIHIRMSLKTRDERQAQRRAAFYDEFMERYWADLIRNSKKDEGLSRFRDAAALARAHGFAYKTISEVAEAPLDEILSRIEATALSSEEKVPALLGGREHSGILLSQCPEVFWPLCVDRFTKKSPHQIRKYQNPRNAAFQNFIEVVGDLPLSEVNRSHVLTFRKWLLDRIGRGEIKGDTANKQLIGVRDILETVALDQELSLDCKVLFAEVRVKVEDTPRLPYDTRMIQELFILGDALDDLNLEARLLFFIMTETGARPSEITGLLPEDYFLNETVPFIWIRENAFRKTLKTSQSERKIPLVGVALMAARLIAPTGFTRYQERPEHASATINKYLRSRGLRPTARHSLYSLRHSYKDRLRDVGAPEEMIDELIGHSSKRPQYGRGHTLEKKHEWLERIAFTPPKEIKP